MVGEAVKMYPVEFQGYLTDGSLAFIVKQCDDVCAEVEIKTVVDAGLWAEIAPLIDSALVRMDLGAK